MQYLKDARNSYYLKKNGLAAFGKETSSVDTLEMKLKKLLAQAEDRYQRWDSGGKGEGTAYPWEIIDFLHRASSTYTFGMV